MSRTIATTGSGSNRRFVMLAIALGLVGAILVYVAFSRDQSGSGGGSSVNTPVVVAKADIPARTTITASMVEVRLVPADAASVLGYTDTESVVGEVTRFPIAANEQILSNKVVPLSGTLATSRSLSYVVPAGKRGFAINASEVQDVGGLVIPGDYVDVMVIYDVEFPNVDGEMETRDSYLVQTLMQNIEVLAVSQSVVDVVPEGEASGSGQRERLSEAKPVPEASTVTLALTPEEAQRLYLAESNGRIRLAVRQYGDAEVQPIEFITELELFPRNLPNPFQR